jgi:hypothetical protein
MEFAALQAATSTFETQLRPSLRAPITAKETALEYARWESLVSEGFDVVMEQGSLLHRFALQLSDPRIASRMAPELTEETREAYESRYGCRPPYNWSAAEADVDDISNGQPGGP